MLNLKYIATEFWDEHANPEFNHLLPGGPWKLMTIISLYLLFVLKVGPAMMKNRKPLEIKPIIKYYNLINIVLNLVMFVLMAYHTNMTLKCWDCSYEFTADERSLVPLCYYAFIGLKYFDLLDTIFFVLRKNDRQITSLHVVHHTFMPIACWLVVKYQPRIQMATTPTYNTLVHVVMYTYYYMAAVPEWRHLLWWKKYLTAMQLVQFAMIFINAVYFSTVYECRRHFSPVVLFPLWCFGIFVFTGFISFYINNYVKEPTATKLETNNNKLDMNKMENVSNKLKGS